MATRLVHEMLATPEPAKTVVDAKEIIPRDPPKPEIIMPVDKSEKDLSPPVLTLPEPVRPVHLSPYVAEALATRASEPTPVEPAAPTAPPSLGPQLHYEQSIPVVETVENAQLEPAAILTEAMSVEIEKIIGAAPKPEATVDHTSWAEFAAAHEPEVERESTPLENFTYFSQSLENWHDSVDAHVVESPDEQVGLAELPSEIPQADKKAMVAISHEVADRLVHLEPVEVDEIAPVIAEITTTIAEIQELSHSKTEGDITILEETKEKLEELCKQLFEALDIEYDEVSVNYFIQVMLLKQFKESIDVAAYKDRLGTHESKHHFPALGAIAQLIAGEVFHFMLGRLALLQADSQEKRPLTQSSLSV